MKTILLSIAILTACALAAQPGEKGANPIPSAVNRPPSTVRAVVIGITNYEDDKIPDLKYADRDAEAFVAWLKSPAGGSVPEGQIKLLVNQQATIGSVYEVLDWLVAESREGDRAIIYFSGHGDIEVKTLRQEGFLLCHNSPPHNYRTNAMAVYWLRDIVEQLSILKKARVVLITDACRAGKLAGNNIGGTQATTAALKEQFAGETKILSCQPNELSLEGEQWGGGRGAFSFHLVNGLYGKADQNADSQVKLKEIWRYLDEHVPAETSPQTQNPIVAGDMETLLSQVDAASLAKIEQEQKASPKVFSPGDLRGSEEAILAKSDSAVQKIYAAFMAAVASGRLMFPEDSSANGYFERLIREPGIAEMHGFLKRRFVAALIDDAQAAINGWLRSDPKEVFSWGTSRRFDYLRFAPQLARAAEILGKGHYLYNDLKAKEYFFRARIQIVEMGAGTTKPDSPLLPALLRTVEEGLKYDSLAPYLFAKKSYYFGYKGDRKTAIVFMQKAIELAPTWSWAYHQLSFQYFQIGKRQKGYESLLQGHRLDSANLYVLDKLGIEYQMDHQFENARKIAFKTVQALDSSKVFQSKEMQSITGSYYWFNGRPDKAQEMLESWLQQSFDSATFHGVFFNSPQACYQTVGWAHLIQGDTTEAEKWFFQSDSINEIYPGAKMGLAMIAHHRGQFQLADEYLSKALTVEGYKTNPGFIAGDVLFYLDIYGRLEETILMISKAIEHYPKNSPLHYHLARLLLEQKNDYKKGLPLLERAVQLDSGHALAHYHLAAAFTHLGRDEAALDFLEKALELGFDDREGIEKDGRWTRLHQNPRFRAMMKAHFPDKPKE